MKHKNLKIIVEAPDNCGKSTLIKNLIKHYKFPFQVLHYYANPGPNYKKFGRELYEGMFQIFHQNPYVIADRSHLGESVYGPIYRNQSGDYIFGIEKKFNTSEIILIVLVDEPENLIAREDGLSFSVDPIIKKQEIDRFVHVYMNSNIKTKILINISQYNEEQLKDYVIKYIEKTKGQGQ